MRQVEINAIVPDQNVKSAYERIRDFKSYPEYSSEVRNVAIESNNGEMFSTWETTFREGLLRWREKDSFDPESNTIVFEQTEGDIEHFSGWWKISSEGAGCRVRFWAQFDMGIPSLSNIIDPIAEQALRENMIAILRGLFGGKVEILSEIDERNFT